MLSKTCIQTKKQVIRISSTLFTKKAMKFCHNFDIKFDNRFFFDRIDNGLDVQRGSNMELTQFS